jgi:hypothetical protein
MTPGTIVIYFVYVTLTYEKDQLVHFINSHEKLNMVVAMRFIASAKPGQDAKTFAAIQLVGKFFKDEILLRIVITSLRMASSD